MALYNNPYQYSFGVPGQMNQFQQQPVQMPAQPVQQPQQYNNVSSGIYIDVPRGCCVNIAVENTSGQAISVANANIVVTREA